MRLIIIQDIYSQREKIAHFQTAITQSTVLWSKFMF
jgi:hypothetical protein